MNRHARRASVKSIRHSDLTTNLVSADTPLDSHPILHHAVQNWYGNIASRRPICIACKTPFHGGETRVGAFLLSVPVGAPDIVVTSAFCSGCHATLTLSEIEAACTRVLRQLAPGGRFLP
ncbi:hypothetical protein ACVI1L_008497 [Bradyrhizobium sp. USDA 4516]